MSLLALVVAGVPSAAADENQDLNLIPSEIQAEPAPRAAAPSAPSPRHLHAKAFVEDVFTLASPARAVPVAYPLPLATWQNRTSVDLYAEWSPRKPVRFTLSNRLNLIEQDGVDFLSRHTVRNDLREAYVSWELTPSTYLEAGRINLRNGAALGFNPTDFFKARTLVGQPSLDPSAIRQNRLGTLMARAQKIWSNGSVGVAFAPKLFEPSRIVDDSRVGVDPSFDATNAANRALGTVSLDLGNWSPQWLGYYEHDRSKIGFNLARPFGDAVVAYVEWAGGMEANLIAQSSAYARTTNEIIASPQPFLPTDTSAAFRNDIAAGASWTIASTLTFNVEYHFHQGGFNRQDWQNWFDINGTDLNPALTAARHWYIRGYAADQQDPPSRHQIFVRASWPSAIVRELELSGFAFVDLYYGSTLAQLIANYYLSNRWTLAAYGAMNAGSARSERGSLPQFGSVVLQVIAYL